MEELLELKQLLLQGDIKGSLALKAFVFILLLLKISR